MHLSLIILPYRKIVQTITHTFNQGLSSQLACALEKNKAPGFTLDETLYIVILLYIKTGTFGANR